MLKIWDPRQSGSGLVWKSSPHAHPSTTTTSTTTKTKTTKTTIPVSSANVSMRSPAISTLAMIHSKGSSDVTYVVTGGGAGDGPSGSKGSSSVVITGFEIIMIMIISNYRTTNSNNYNYFTIFFSRCPTEW